MEEGKKIHKAHNELKDAVKNLHAGVDQHKAKIKNFRAGWEENDTSKFVIDSVDAVHEKIKGINEESESLFNEVIIDDEEEDSFTT